MPQRHMPVETRAQKKKRLAAAAHAAHGVRAFAKRPKLRRASLAACAMCLEEMWLPRILACGHAFHAGCLRAWQSYGGTCPLCRAPVEERGWRCESVVEAFWFYLTSWTDSAARAAAAVWPRQARQACR